jgi:hypothetical protein
VKTSAAVLIIVVIAVFFVGYLLFGHRMSPEEKAKRRVVYRGLREFVFCDQSLSKSLEFFACGSDFSEVRSFLDAGEFSQAQKLLEQEALRSRHSDDMGYWLILARARQGAGDDRGALDAVVTGLQNSPEESRTQALAWSVMRELGRQPESNEADKVLGAVVELGWFGGTITIAGYADGDARLLMSSGAGFIGEMTQIPEVSKAAQALVTAADRLVGSLPVSTDRPLPEQGRAGFYILTPGGTHAVDEAESEAKRPGHHLRGMYSAAQDLITAFRKHARKAGEVPLQ